jgi:hypothetical protein
MTRRNARSRAQVSRLSRSGAYMCFFFLLCVTRVCLLCLSPRQRCQRSSTHPLSIGQGFVEGFSIGQGFFARILWHSPADPDLPPARRPRPTPTPTPADPRRPRPPPTPTSANPDPRRPRLRPRPQPLVKLARQTRSANTLGYWLARLAGKGLLGWLEGQVLAASKRSGLQ